jgi:hypothetical protein
VLPVCNAEAMQLYLDDIAAKVAPRAYAVLIFDQAGSPLLWPSTADGRVPRAHGCGCASLASSRSPHSRPSKGAVSEHVLRGVALVQKPIELAVVMHRRVGHRIAPDQLVRPIHIQMPSR